MVSRRAHNAFSRQYSMGDRGRFATSARYQDNRLQAIKATSPEYSECTRCKRKYKNPEAMHYTDFKNKIRCIEKVR